MHWTKNQQEHQAQIHPNYSPQQKQKKHHEYARGTSTPGSTQPGRCPTTTTNHSTCGRHPKKTQNQRTRCIQRGKIQAARMASTNESILQARRMGRCPRCRENSVRYSPPDRKCWDMNDALYRRPKTTQLDHVATIRRRPPEPVW